MLMFCNKQLSILHKNWKATKMSIWQFYQWVYHRGCINEVLNFDGCRLEYGLPKRLLTEWCYWENNGRMTKITEKHFSTYILQISVKFANDVFFVPILTTCGGFMTNFFFSPVTISGFLARIMSNTRVNNCGH